MTTKVFVGEKRVWGRLKEKVEDAKMNGSWEIGVFPSDPIDGSYIHIHRRKFDDSHVKTIWLSGVVRRPLETFHEQNCDWLCRTHCDDVERTRRIWSSSTTSTRWVLNSTNCSKMQVPSVNQVWRRSPERVSSSGSSTDPPPCKTRRAFTFPVDNHQRTASQERLFWFRFDNEWIWVMDNVKVEYRRNVYFCASEPQWRSKQTKKWK